jgi:hypothetical protein
MDGLRAARHRCRGCQDLAQDVGHRRTTDQMRVARAGVVGALQLAQHVAGPHGLGEHAVQVSALTMAARAVAIPQAPPPVAMSRMPDAGRVSNADDPGRHPGPRRGKGSREEMIAAGSVRRGPSPMPVWDLSLRMKVRVRDGVRIDQRDLRAEFNAALDGSTKPRIRSQPLIVHSRHEQFNESLPLLGGYLATTVDVNDPREAAELLRVPLCATECLTQECGQMIDMGVHPSTEHRLENWIMK